MSEKSEVSLSEFDELFGSDESTEAEGAWMPVPGKEGWEIKLRSQHSAKVRDMAGKQVRKHLSLYQARKNVPAAVQDSDNIELLAKSIVVGWTGFDNIPCTPDNVRAVMGKYPAFREMVLAWADERENYRKAETEAIKGNS